VRPEESLGNLLAGADDQAADDSTRHGREAADDEHRQRLERQEGDGELHAELGAPHRGRHQGHETATSQTTNQIQLIGDADRLGGGVIVGHRAERAAGLGALEEDGEPRHQDAGDQPAPHVELVDQDAARERALEQEPGVGRKQAQRVDIRAEDHL
jgi:hypothetical protein